MTDHHQYFHGRQPVESTPRPTSGNRTNTDHHGRHRAAKKPVQQEQELDVECFWAPDCVQLFETEEDMINHIEDSGEHA